MLCLSFSCFGLAGCDEKERGCFCFGTIKTTPCQDDLASSQGTLCKTRQHPFRSFIACTHPWVLYTMMPRVVLGTRLPVDGERAVTKRMAMSGKPLH